MLSHLGFQLALLLNRLQKQVKLKKPPFGEVEGFFDFYVTKVQEIK